MIIYRLRRCCLPSGQRQRRNTNAENSPHHRNIVGLWQGHGRALPARGWNVLATMRRPDPSVFADASGRLTVLPLDVTDEQSIDAAIAAGVAALGAIDVWVNNAGVGLASIVEATPDSTIREVFETNTFGVFAACRAIIPQMRKQGQGVIVNVTSSAAIGVMPLVAVYAASKCAVEGFTESMAYELEGVRHQGAARRTRLRADDQLHSEWQRTDAGLIPADYDGFAQACFARMANYPTRLLQRSRGGGSRVRGGDRRGREDPLSRRSGHEASGRAALEHVGGPLPAKNAHDVQPHASLPDTAGPASPSGIASCRRDTRRANHFCLSEIVSSPLCKNISLNTSGKSPLLIWPSRPTRGVAHVTNARWDAMDATASGAQGIAGRIELRERSSGARTNGA